MKTTCTSTGPPSSSLVLLTHPTQTEIPLQSGHTLYLTHPSHKFWEISLLHTTSLRRFGKLHMGEETDVETEEAAYHSVDEALLQCKALVAEKLTKGFVIRQSADGEPTPWVHNYINDENEVRAAKNEQRARLMKERMEEEARKRKAASMEIIDCDLEVDPYPGDTASIPIKKARRRSRRGRGKRRRGKPKDKKPSPQAITRERGAARLENLSQVLMGKAGFESMIETTVVDADGDDVVVTEGETPRRLPEVSLPDLTALIGVPQKRPSPPIEDDPPAPKPVKKPKLVPSKPTEPSQIPEFIELLLAQSWESSINPKGWLMSEKLDGVRCYWNGKQLVSRQGHPYSAPLFFISGFPSDTSLDGELWVGRKQFQRCVSIVRKSDTEKHDFEEWKQVKYLLFDAPSIPEPFEKRLDYLKKLAKTVNSPYLVAHEHAVCRDAEHLHSELKRVCDLGGEGVMLRQAGSLYENKRSKTLLKVKTFQDAEGTVIGYEPGKGKNEGLVGAMKVRTDDGVEFKVGTGLSDADRKNPPPIGSRITYKYQELTTGGIPRFPSFLRAHPGL